VRRPSDLKDPPLWLSGIGYLIDWDTFPIDVFFPVPGYPDLEVNIEGHVYCSRIGGILIPSLLGKGYRKIHARDPNKNNFVTKIAVHRIVALAFHCNSQNKSDVNHKDGVKSNNHAKNLEWSTRKENIQHALDTGLMGFGADANGASLNAGQVREIRRLAGEMSYVALARMFGVHRKTIKAVVLGSSYQNVDPGYAPAHDLEERVRMATISELGRGSESPNAKLKPDQVREIRRLKGLMIAREVGKRFNVTDGTVTRIWRGVGYSDVE
jgi:hypothetical protein